MHAFRCYIFAARIACDSGPTCSQKYQNCTYAPLTLKRRSNAMRWHKSRTVEQRLWPTPLGVSAGHFVCITRPVHGRHNDHISDSVWRSRWVLLRLHARFSPSRRRRMEAEWGKWVAMWPLMAIHDSASINYVSETTVHVGGLIQDWLQYTAGRTRQHTDTDSQPISTASLCTLLQRLRDSVIRTSTMPI